jgi:hypothetical protein
MRHLKTFSLFEWNIPGDPVGDPHMMDQDRRVPDTHSIKISRGDWMTKKKRKKKKVPLKKDI